MAILRMKKPTLRELREYAQSVGFDEFDAEEFLAHYESNGWMVGRVPMRSWQAAVVTWKKHHWQFRRKPEAQRMPINVRNKRINELNERKAYWMRAPESAKRSRELEQIRVELQTL